MKEIGQVTHYYDKIGVAIVKLKGSLESGDKIKIKGATDDLEQEVDSMQIDHENVEKAKKGDEVGIKVDDKVHVGSTVSIVEE